MSALRDDYLELLKRCNLNEDSLKASFRDRFETIQLGGNSDIPELKHSAMLWKDIMKAFPSPQTGFSVEEKVNDISTSLSKHPPLYGHSVMIQRLIKDFGLVLEEEVYFNIFPTSDFNASAFPTTNGSLILLNRGIIKLIHNVIYNSFYLISDQYKSAGDQPLFEEKVTLHTVSIIANYLLREQHRSFFVNDFELDKDSFYTAFILIGAVKNFIVAHEMAHVLLGHNKQGDIRNVRSENEGEVNVITKSHTQEFEADSLAQQLLIHSDQHKLSMPSLGGGIGFLLIDLMVSNVHSKLSGMPGLYKAASKTHPSSMERIRRLDQLIQKFDYKKIIEGLVNCTVLQKQLILIEKSDIGFNGEGVLEVQL